MADTVPCIRCSTRGYYDVGQRGCIDHRTCRECGGRGKVPAPPEPECDNLCVMAPDVLPGADPSAVAYPHPGCPLHDPGAVCECGTPDRCLSPTHGQISMDEAQVIRHAQRPVNDLIL